ncbi:MAG: hypothetical protein JXA92_12595 [candidate division Zixibacteria bacterium]|nr:hypothetical protein [candidate division Zixibacteria bacterium]
MVRLTAIILVCSTAAATSIKCERETLKGLKGMQVLVEEIKQGEVVTALDLQALQTDIEAVLSEEKLEIHDSSKASWEGNFLVATVSVMRPSNDLKTLTDWYIYTVELALRQRVNLVRKRWVKTSAITWIGTLTGVTDLEGLNAGVKKSVFINLGKFIEDYRQVNE